MKYLLLLLLFTSCYSPKAYFNSYDDLMHSPYGGEVRLLEKLPEDGYQLVGMVKTSGFLINSDSQMINVLKKEAAKQGANAIFMPAGNVKTDIDISLKDFAPSQSVMALGTIPVAREAMFIRQAYKSKSQFEEKAPKKAFAYALRVKE